MAICRLFELKKVTTAITGIIVLSAGLFCLLNYEMTSAASFDFIKPFIERNVICDVPDQRISSPANFYDDNIQGLMLYIKQNPLNFLQLLALRFIAFWGLVRSYYSSVHNLVLQLFFYPLYFFAVIKTRSLAKINFYFTLYCLGILSVFTISVMLTCDEWSNRFIMPVIPIVILLASYGIVNSFSRKTTKPG